MKPLADLARRFDGLARRERVLVLVAGVTLILGLAFALVIDPALARAKAARATIAERQAQVAMLRGVHAEQLARLAQDVNTPVREALAKADEDLAVLEGEIRTFQQTLIPANSMGQVLAGLLRKDIGAKLVSLRNLPPEPLLADGNPAGTPAARSGDVPARALLYRHGIELVVEGGYFDLLDYVSALEKQPWRVLWSETSLTGTYPVSRLRLKLHTLSLDASWLSV